MNKPYCKCPHDCDECTSCICAEINDCGECKRMYEVKRIAREA